MEKKGIGKQVGPQVLSTIKMLLGIPIYFLGAAGYWIAFVSVSLFNIWLDRADGDWARRIQKYTQYPIWKYGPRYNGLTDIWQAGFIIPVFGWYTLIPAAFMLVGFLMSTIKDEAGAWGRFILVANSMISMTIAFCIVSDKITGDWWIAVPIVLMGLFMLYLTWGSWVKNIRGK